jgi:hypothetical protein
MLLIKKKKKKKESYRILSTYKIAPRLIFRNCRTPFCTRKKRKITNKKKQTADLALSNKGQ